MGVTYFLRRRNGREPHWTHRIAMGLGACVFLANFLCGNVSLAENEWTVQNDVFIPMDMVVEYWGNQLTENERTIYNRMLLDALSGKREKVCVVYEFPHIWDLSEDEIAGMVSNMVARAYSAFTYDYPLYRPLSYSYQYEVVGIELTVEIELEEFYEEFWTDLPVVQKEIADMEDEIKGTYQERMMVDESFEDDSDEVHGDGMPDENATVVGLDGIDSKELDDSNQILVDLSWTENVEEFLLLELIYESVIEHTVYSFDVEEIVTEYESDLDDETFGVSAAMLDRFHHHGVCSAYSGLFQILCNDFGISCIQVCNNGTSVSSSHSYNYVRIDDGWYLVDCTWGDEEGSINWDSFLCGSKVSLDGRCVGTQLANPYVMDSFVAPKLTDTFYFSLTNAFIRDNEKRSVVYDLCQGESVRNQKELIFYPKSDAVLANGIVDYYDPGRIVISSRYLLEDLSQEYEITTYPTYEYVDNRLVLMSLTPFLKISAIPYIIAEEYCFGYEGSDVSFVVAREQFDEASSNYEDFSLKMETDLSKVQSMLSGKFKREEAFRKQSDAIYAVVFSDWSGFYEESRMQVRIPVFSSIEDVQVHSDCVVTTKDILYAVGMKENGELCELGEVLVQREPMDEPGEFQVLKKPVDASGYIVLPGDCKAVLLYEKEWKEASDYRLAIVGILVITLVIVVILWKCRKRAGKGTRR